VWAIALVLAGCSTQQTRKPWFAKDRTFKSERKNTLVAFIGEKIEVTEMPYKPGDFDLRVKAKYKIIQLVYGNYSKDTIEFEAYDHYGTPAFSQFKHVLLYVSNYKGKYYHEKYQYDDVYKTRDGRWAGTYQLSYDSPAIKPVKIDFVEEVSYPIISPVGYDRYDELPEPYFIRTGNKAVAVYGVYAEDLFRMKRDGVLTARGLFGKPAPEKSLIVQDVELEEVVDADTTEVRQLGMIDAYLNSLVTTRKVPGIAVAITKDDRTIYRKSFGFTNIQTGEKLVPSHIFNAASISQTFTAAAILKLMERKMLDINQPLVTYLPYFKLADDRYKDITLKQLLNHTSGLPDVKDFEWEKAAEDTGATERYVRSLANEKLISQPGKEFHHSNMGYDILGHLISKVSGVPFETYVKATILYPSDIQSSFNYPYIKKWLTSPHTGDPFFVSPVYPYNRMHAPSSAIHTRIDDLSDWAELNKDGEHYDRQILSPETHEMMFTPSFTIDSAKKLYSGLGWIIHQWNGNVIREQGGCNFGYCSLITIIPGKNITVAILCNRDGLEVNAVRDKILEIISG
jgi:CubicO group peptidase (beta-lactamase class C family)